MVRERVKNQIQKLRLMEKVKELQTQLQKIRLSLQSMKNHKIDPRS